LEHAGELNNVVVPQVEHGLFPLLRSNGVVLLFLVGFSFLVRLVSATVLAAAKVLGGTLLVLLDETFVLGGAGRVVEGGGKELETVFLELEGLGLLIKRLVFLLVDKLGLTALLKLLDILLFLMLLVDAVLFRSIELAIDIRTKVLLFELFPPVSVELTSAETKLSFFLCIFTVLAARVQTDNVLNLLLVIRSRLDGLPFFLLSLVLTGLLVLLLGLLTLLFFLFPLGFLVFLFSTALMHIKHLADTIIEGLFVKA